MLNAEPLERPSTLKDLAYRKIREYLVSGRIEPDKVYSALQFAELLGVSRTPVRDALQQLAAEGLLVFAEGRGFRLKPYSPKEIQDIFETRRVIETFVVEQLVGKISKDDLALLDRNLERMAAQGRRKQPHAFLETDREFHMTLVNRQGNRHLETIMDTIRTHIEILGLTALSHEGRPEQVIQEHGAILLALGRKDKAAAVTATRHHLVTTEKYVLERLGKG